MQYSGYDEAFRCPVTQSAKRRIRPYETRGDGAATNAPSKNMETSGKIDGEGREEEDVVQERWIRFCAIPANDARIERR